MKCRLNPFLRKLLAGSIAAPLSLTALCLFTAPEAQAADNLSRFWSGTGTWDANTTANWGTVTGGPYTSTWGGGYELATFEGTAGTVTVSGSVSVNAMTFAVDGYTISGGTINWGNGATTPISVISGATATINSALTQGGTSNPLVIGKSGYDGTLIFGGTGLSTKPVRIDYGTLQLNNATALQSSTVTMNGNSAALTFGNSLTAFTLGGLAASSAGTGYDISLLNISSAAVALSVGNNNTNTAYAGVLSGGGSLLKIGTGTLTLSGANTYTGTTTVQGGGKLTISGSGSISPTTGAALNVQGVGTFQYDSSATSKFGSLSVGTGASNSGTFNQTDGAINVTSITTQTSLSGSNTAVLNLSGGTLTSSGMVTFSSRGGPGTGAGSTTVNISGTATLNANAGLRIGANTSYSNGATINQTGGQVTVAGGLNLARVPTGANTARGIYNLDGGTLSTNAITQDATSGTSVTNGTFNFNGGTLKPSADNTAFMEGLTTTQIKAGGAKIDTNGKNVTIAQALTEDAAGRTLRKDGLGTLTLSGASSYSGATTISQGKLIMGDAAVDTFATSEVTVASGATLGGSGTISGTLGVTGILAPGNSIGTLNAGTTTWNGGDDSANTIWQFELGANGASDKLNITGDFVKGGSGTYKFNFMGSTPTWGSTYTLVDWSGSLTDFVLDDFSFTGLSSYWTPSTFAIDTTNKWLTFTAVPEPTSALAGLLITAGLLRRSRA